jgi:hypothetical protein
MRTLLVSLLLSSPAFALTFNEGGAGGDLYHDESNPRWLGALSSGVNTVSGVVTDRGDTFAFDLNPGQSVLGAQLTIYNLVSNGDYAIGRFYIPNPRMYFDSTYGFSDGSYAMPVEELVDEAHLAFTASPASLATYIWTLEMNVGRACVGGQQLLHEVLDGDLPDSEPTAMDLGELAAGTWVLCGNGLDEDALRFRVASGANLVSLEVDVLSFPSTPGANTALSLFDPATLAVLDTHRVLGTGTYPLDVAALGGAAEVGVAAGQIIPGGIAYDYQITVVIERPPPIIVDTQPAAGTTHTFRMEGFTPGSQVYLLAGTAAGSVAVPGCAGQSVGIRQPRVLGPTRAAADGVVSVTVPIPAALAGVQARLQAVELASCTLSTLATFNL